MSGKVIPNVFFVQFLALDESLPKGTVREDVSATKCLLPALDAKLDIGCVWLLYHTFHVVVGFCNDLVRSVLCSQELYRHRVRLDGFPVVTVDTASPSVPDGSIDLVLQSRACCVIHEVL